MASSMRVTKSLSSSGVSFELLDIPDAAAFRVEILNSLCASMQCSGLTTDYKCIFAIDSDKRMMASSCLTVIGMPLVFLEMCYSLLAALSVTYMF